ncbi:hypothetical protein [Streptomyces sp. CB02009]|uniref:hypothetical protein n=1 Tax=Streptomyces sp. CB02009 TaxID=1703938 RepID=UPI000A78D420|nr:hypothetical protein [Streptomyces sp. CB02009]
MNDEALAAFATYCRMVERATQRINAGEFIFERDIAPFASPGFCEIAEGIAKSIEDVQVDFGPIIQDVKAGAAFSWEVTLESSTSLAQGAVLLVTSSLVSRRCAEGALDVVQYRITNIMKLAGSGEWKFEHQHRTRF